MHFGLSNTGRTYTEDGKDFKRVVYRGVLGHKFIALLKMAPQMDKVVKLVFTSAFIGRVAEDRNWDIFLLLILRANTKMSFSIGFEGFHLH